MKITLVTVGKIKEKYYTAAIEEYSKRLSRYCKLEIIQVADEKTPDNAGEALETQIKEKEGDRILASIRDGACVIALERCWIPWNCQRKSPRWAYREPARSCSSSVAPWGSQSGFSTGLIIC